MNPLYSLEFTGRLKKIKGKSPLFRSSCDLSIGVFGNGVTNDDFTLFMHRIFPVDVEDSLEPRMTVLFRRDDSRYNAWLILSVKYVCFLI